MLGIARARKVLRVDGPEKVRGSAWFSAEVRLPGLLFGAALRSPFPHARIRSLDLSRAQRLPGVLAILTARDLPTRRVGKGLQDMPLLATDRVRFVGEKVAVVAAESREQADEAVRAIAVDYEELLAVFDLESALRPEAPVLHPERASYGFATGRQAYTPPPHPNANAEVMATKGDVERGLATSR